MPWRLLLFILILLCWISLSANQFYPRLYLEGYFPRINNKVDIYKLHNGLSYERKAPFLINTFAPDSKEKILFEDQKVIISTKVGDTKIIEDVTVSFDSYFAAMRKKVFLQSIRERATQKTQSTQTTQAGLIKDFTIELPKIAVPKAVQKVLGSKAGRLSLDGTQKISFEGSSTKRKQVPIYETENKSTFDLKMKQETNIRLTGTIGEKISVNLKYNSQQDEQFFDPNNVNIKYTGYEDEIIQLIEAGNISLALSGSRYISYSSSSQGLFGITSKWKYGNLDLTMIASKEEGKKNTQTYVGQSQADSTIFRSRDYAPRTMYFITDPYQLYDLYSEADTNIPPGWADNSIKMDDFGAWQKKNPALLPEYGTMKLYLDDAIVDNNYMYTPGDDIMDGNNILFTPYWEELVEGTDFITDYDAGIVQILRPIERRASLGVRYVGKNLQPVPPNSDAQDGLLHVSVIRRRNQEYYAYDKQNPQNPDNIWHYQMRNVFNLNKTNIKNDGFYLEIYNENEDRTRNYNLPDSLAVGGLGTYADYLRLDTNGDSIINGDDSTVILSSGLVIFPLLNPFLPFGDIQPYQEENENVSYLDINMYMSVKGKIGRDAIDLAQGGLLKGSVRVKVNGTEQRENVDYLVDYDFGRITFLTAAGKDPDARIEIDYEFRSIFDVARKSLAGIRANWEITDNAKLGGTLIYRSESVNERRPKIGNENIEMWLADIDGSITLKPKFITTWVDALPLISTSAESRLALSGEMAVTIPKLYGDPNGKKRIAYIDDMESIVDSYPLGISHSTWVLGSKPFETNLAKGRTNWYNPKNILREQIEDPNTLTDKERKETASVLAMKVFPNNLNIPGSDVWSWGGVMKYIGNQLDFSAKKYIELLVRVEGVQGSSTPNTILKVDLGDLNEDFYTEFGGFNNRNTEDKNGDGVLTIDEDLGLDGIAHGQPGHDPNDLASDEQGQDNDYPYINGTEGNRVLDTEDLDGDGVLDTLDRYFSYGISLNDDRYLESINDYGWRLYRIPLADPDAYNIVNNVGSGTPPNLKKISYTRLRVETDSQAKVLIADVNIVGNKWQDFLVRDLDGNWFSDADLAVTNTSYISGIVNNQKNGATYTSPEGTTYMEDDKESSESALSLTINNLMPDTQVLLRQRMLDSYNLLSYGSLRFWVYPEGLNTAATNDSMEIVFRVGADSTNYYQIRQKVGIIPNRSKMDKYSWMEFSYPLGDITTLKQFTTTSTPADTTIGNTTYSIRGNPTLTNIREICFGVLNNSDLMTGPYSGTVFFNDLRVADPYDDIGWAKRLTFNTSLADFITLDVDFEQKSENFNPVIQRGRQSSFTETTALNITNKYFINKFFPNSWNLDIPLNLNRNYSIGIPRYRANSDLLRDDITDPVEKAREKNETLIYAADVAFSQRTAPKNKILFYTLHRTSLSGRVEQAFRNTPTTRDTTLTWRAVLNYNLAFPADKSSFTIWKNYKFTYLPSNWNNSFQINSTEPKSFNWENRTTGANWYPRAQTIRSKTLTTDNSINWNLTNDITSTIRLNTKRDLLQRDSLWSINIGKQTEYVQDLGLNYNPNYFPRIMNITTATTAKYTEYQKKYSQSTPEGYVDVYEKDGNSQRTFRANVGLMNSTWLTSWAQKIRAKSPAKPSASSEPKDKETIPVKELGEKAEISEEEQKKLKEMDTNFDNLSEEEIKKLLDSRDLQNWEKNNDKPKDDFGNSDPKDKQDPKDKPKEPRPEFNLPATLVEYLTKIKNINASFQNSYGMVYTRKQDRPPFAFQLALPHSVERDFLDSISDDNTLTFASGIAFSRTLDSNINFSYTDNKRYSTASTQTISQTFPDVTLTLNEVDQWIGVSKFLANMRLNTGYQYNIRQTGNINFSKPKQETKTQSFNPLIGVTTNVLNAVSTNVSLVMTQSENITDMESYEILRTSDSKGISSSFTYSYRAGKGFKIPLTNKRIHIRNELTSSLSIQYEESFDETIGRDASVVDRNTTRLVFTPAATYQFNSDIRGGLTGGYEINTDKKRDDGTKILRLGIWVEITL